MPFKWEISEAPIPLSKWFGDIYEAPCIFITSAMRCTISPQPTLSPDSLQVRLMNFLAYFSQLISERNFGIQERRKKELVLSLVWTVGCLLLH